MGPLDYDTDGPSSVFHDESSSKSDDTYGDDFSLVKMSTRNRFGRHHGMANHRNHRKNKASFNLYRDFVAEECDVWKILSTLLISFAFSISCTLLSLCTIIELQAQHEPDPLSFGLWSYSDPDRNIDGILLPYRESKRQCRSFTSDTENGFGPQSVVEHGSSDFHAARICAISATVLGGLVALNLWLGVAMNRKSSRTDRGWFLIMLLTSAVLVIGMLEFLRSAVCDSADQGIYRRCLRGRGVNSVFWAYGLYVAGALVFWFKWPRQGTEGQNYKHGMLAGDERDVEASQRPLTGLQESEDEQDGRQLELSPYKDTPSYEEGVEEEKIDDDSSSSSYLDTLTSFDEELVRKNPEESPKPPPQATTQFSLPTRGQLLSTITDPFPPRPSTSNNKPVIRASVEPVLAETTKMTSAPKPKHQAGVDLSKAMPILSEEDEEEFEEEYSDEDPENARKQSSNSLVTVGGLLGDDLSDRLA